MLTAIRLEGGGPPHSTALTTSDFHLFGPLKMRLAAMRFAVATDVKQAATFLLQTLDTAYQSWSVKPWCSCGRSGDTSILARRKSGVYHLLPMCHVYIAVGTKLSASERLWRYSFEASL